MNSFIKSFLSVFLVTASLVHAEFFYTIRDLGTLESDRSEARSLNDSGWVAGKYFLNERVSDFVWDPETGLELITDEADKEIMPRLNNAGRVVGSIFKPASWFSRAQIQVYAFNKNNEIKLSEPVSRGDGLSFFINNLYMITSHHLDLFQSTASFLSTGSQIVQLTDHRDIVKAYTTAINNGTQILISAEIPGVFDSSFLATYYFKIYDAVTGEFTFIADDQFYAGTGINDEGLVIARNRKGTEGFYGSAELGMISLGNFIPTALNNAGDIVGKKGPIPLLRKSEGTMIDLNKTVDLTHFNITRITDVFAINNLGQILVSAQIAGKSQALLLEPINEIL